MPVKNRIQPGDGDERHGTLNGYTNHGCHCDLCTEAHRVAHLDYMHANPEQQEKHARRENERYHSRA
jgi:hypothetical protein